MSQRRYYSTDIATCARAYWAAKKPGRQIIISDSAFGTTCMSSRIYAHEKICGVLVHKDLLGEEPPFPIETEVCLLRPSDSAVRALVDSERYESIPFIWVSIIYYKDEGGREIKIPSTREEMAYSRSISPEDKMTVYKMGMVSFDKNFESLSEGLKKTFLDVFSDKQGVREYLEHFGGAQYFFPACPCSEVSRALVQSCPNIVVDVSGPRSPRKENRGQNATKKPAQESPKEDSAPDSARETPPCKETSSGTASPCTNKSPSFSDPEPAPSVYVNVFILKFPISPIPSRHIHSIKGVLFHLLHVRVYGLLYAYVWAPVQIPPGTLHSLGIVSMNVLFHCEFSLYK
ncbi:uncharacterized protein NEMAJ01_0446 [Nematocida major]|uniref:uncharacterized protein n=1 Tax=Nematocida major TaxID=1912982 RepID=UPI0020080D75|nr:uncharacterized protein NEMAJ01_0446 [Nematocida major]KAH9385550.1 hypothetical protein NEMAJ01_0446 [Nematocida major]